MPHPQPVSHFTIGMAERYEVVIDFAKYTPGQRVVLQEHCSPKNNVDFDTTDVVMAFQVGDHVSDRSNNEIPRDLNPNMNVMGLTEKDAVQTRHFRFERDNGSWTINGHTWEDVINSDYQDVVADPGLDDIEIWELENKSGGWFHPVHIHLVDFKVLDRNGEAAGALRAGPQGRRLRRGERDGPRDHALRAPRGPVHDALPQPGPRGPRHDDPVPRSAPRRTTTRITRSRATPPRSCRPRRSSCGRTMTTTTTTGAAARAPATAIASARASATPSARPAAPARPAPRAAA